MENRKRRWTKEEDSMLKKLIDEGLTVTQIQKKIPNRTRDAIASRRRLVAPKEIDSSIWTEDNLTYLRENHLKETPKQISQATGIGYTSIVEKLKQLDLYSANAGHRIWTKDEVEFLKEKYMTRRYSSIARDLRRTTSSVEQKANLLGLKKPKPRKWKAEEIQYLKDNYHKKSVSYFVEKLKRPRHSIYSKAYELKLDSSNREKDEADILYVIANSETKTDEQIARTLRCSVDRVATIRKDNGIFKTGSMSAIETGIEKKVRNELELLNVDFIEQHNFGQYISDFFIPHLNLAIEVNGDYWHCNPEIYPGGPKNPEQIRFIVKDYYKKCFYVGNNISVLYLWENDILNKFENVQHKLKTYLELPSPEETLVMMNAELSGKILPANKGTGQSETEG